MKTSRRLGRGLLCLLPLLLAGCTGSGPTGGSLGAGGVSPMTLTGSVVSSDGAALSGYQVVYDPTSQIAPLPDSGATTATTNSLGQFTFSVSPGQVTGSDTVSVFDSAGHHVASAAITPGQAASIVITPIPPPSPTPQQI